MELFWTIFERIIPLYLLIGLGFVAARVLKIRKEGVAAFLIYMVIPVVIFSGILNTELRPEVLSLPILFYLVCTSIAGAMYRFAGRFWGSPTKNILGFGAGTANNGYFGLPVAIYLFGDQIMGLVVLSTLGFTLFENTVGFYITARGHHGARDAFLRVARLPAVYAALLAIALNASGFVPGKAINDFALNFRGAYTVLGMMMIGMGIADAERLRPDFRFIGMSFLAKFIVWPAIMVALVYADLSWWHFWDGEIHKILILMGSVPMAANTVAVASLLRTDPDKAAMAVLASTIFALFFIPFMVSMFIGAL